MLHIKFIEISDKNKVWHVESFDGTAMAEDEVENRTMMFVDTTSVQSIHYDNAALSNKEGYFVILYDPIVYP